MFKERFNGLFSLVLFSSRADNLISFSFVSTNIMTRHLFVCRSPRGFEIGTKNSRRIENLLKKHMRWTGRIGLMERRPSGALAAPGAIGAGTWRAKLNVETGRRRSGHPGSQWRLVQIDQRGNEWRYHLRVLGLWSHSNGHGELISLKIIHAWNGLACSLKHIPPPPSSLAPPTLQIYSFMLLSSYIDSYMYTNISTHTWTYLHIPTF